MNITPRMADITINTVAVRGLAMAKAAPTRPTIDITKAPKPRPANSSPPPIAASMPPTAKNQYGPDKSGDCAKYPDNQGSDFHGQLSVKARFPDSGRGEGSCQRSGWHWSWGNGLRGILDRAVFNHNVNDALAFNPTQNRNVLALTQFYD